jgi:hypothetical protein
LRLWRNPGLVCGTPSACLADAGINGSYMKNIGPIRLIRLIKHYPRQFRAAGRAIAPTESILVA